MLFSFHLFTVFTLQNVILAFGLPCLIHFFLYWNYYLFPLVIQWHFALYGWRVLIYDTTPFFLFKHHMGLYFYLEVYEMTLIWHLIISLPTKIDDKANMKTKAKVKKAFTLFSTKMLKNSFVRKKFSLFLIFW